MKRGNMNSWICKNYKLPICKFRGFKVNIKYPCLVSVKYDGELEYIIKKNGKVYMVNKPEYGRYREGGKALEEFAKLNLPDGVYLAELIAGEGRRKEDFYELLKNRTSDDLKLKIFGKIDLDTRKTISLLKRIKGTYVSPVKFWVVRSEKQLKKLINKWILKEGYEGLVARNMNAKWIQGKSHGWVKIKRVGRELYTSRYGWWIGKERFIL